MPALVDATPKSLTTSEALLSHPIRPKYDNLPVLNKGVFEVTGNCCWNEPTICLSGSKTPNAVWMDGSGARRAG